LVYELSTSYARGKFHFLQNTDANRGGAVLADSVMTIQNDGKVGIGTAAPGDDGLSIAYPGSAPQLQLKMASTGHVHISNNTSDKDMNFATAGTGDIYFAPGGTNHIAFLDSGNVGIGDTSPDYALDVVKSESGSYVAMFEGTHGSNPYGAAIHFSAAAPNNTTSQFIYCADSSQARFAVYSNGSVQNVEGTYGSSLSDERLKKDITPAKSQWDDVKNIDIVNYKIATEGNDAKKLMSVVAQQVQKVSPMLVGERPPHKSEVAFDSTFGTLYEGGDELPKNKEIGDIKEEKEKVLFFKDSIFFWKCAKALQEAMAKIETLEAKVEALENA